jgi:hypothetical protein
MQAAPVGPREREKLQVKFPVPAKKIPVPRNIFPVNLRGEFYEKPLRHSGFLLLRLEALDRLHQADIAASEIGRS